MKNLAIAILILAALTGCRKNEDSTDEIKADRTVLVYISGECSLTNMIDDELSEMKEGSKTIGDNNLLVYVDRGLSKELPWLARISNGEIKDSVSIYDMIKVSTDPYASDPLVMENIIRYAFNHYPSKNSDYGLVLWGHASGWLIDKDSIQYSSMARRRAYGVDNGVNSASNNGKQINIPTLAKVLSKLPHLRFIFGDCCNFQTLESAYELRNVTDYIIASPAEIPDVGAPYDTVVPAMFETSTFYSSVIDKYFAQQISGMDVPLSVIKTSEMENLASATRTVLKANRPNIEGTYPDMSGLIHYYFVYKYFDANDFILKYASESDYNVWKQVLDKAIVYKKMAKRWVTNVSWSSFYQDFTVTEEKFGGVSMHVPQSPYNSNYSQYNEDIKKMSWYYAAGYSDIGW